MSTSGISLGSTAGAPITVSGLASGLDTSSIIAALMGVEREPVDHLGEQQAKLQAAQSELQSVQSSLQQLAASASEFELPSLFESSQTVTSNEPQRVAASVTGGAGAGGYEVEVTGLASAAQRTFTFKSPASEDTLTIDGQQFAIKAGETIKEVASAINSDTNASVYAAVVESGTIVLSNRATGNTGNEFIKVTDPGAALTEVSSREGKDAEFSVDGQAGTSSTNTIKNAIAGVTLTLNGITSDGPVTIVVQPPGPSVGAIESQVQSFVRLYNSTVSAIQTQLNTKPPVKPQTGEEGVGTLFADPELTALLDAMRQTMYEPIRGLAAEMSSPADVGISTGAPTGGGATSQATLEGQLTLDPAKLAEAVRADPAGVEQMLRSWSGALQGIVNAAAGPGATIAARIDGDEAQVSQLGTQISAMNEMLAVREKSLQETYAHLEAVISQNSELGDWLTKQSETS